MDRTNQSEKDFAEIRRIVSIKTDVDHEVMKYNIMVSYSIGYIFGIIILTILNFYYMRVASRWANSIAGDEINYETEMGNDMMVS